MSERYPHLKANDPEVYDLIQRQAKLESTTLKMIASESYASLDVLEACGSIFTNKYSEGYPGARYYEGNEVTDALENLAIERGKEVFGCEHMNVQPYSGSPANAAVYRAILDHGDKVMGVPVSDGGHLTHGWKVSFSGQDFIQVPYRPNQETGRLDMTEVREIALRERPKMIWAGMSAYPFQLDYAAFADIAREVDAYLVADIAHINALIIAGVHPDPVPHCDVVTSTSHKMLRGPRAGFIMSKIEDRYHDKYHSDVKWNLAQLIDRGVFPTMQGGPHMNAIAAMAAAFKFAQTEEFKDYGKQIVKNAQALCAELEALGRPIAGGGTETHILLLDFRKEEFTGKDAAQALAKCGIITNFNMVPGDARSPFKTSGVRLGTPSLTSAGMKEPEMKKIAEWIDRVCTNIDNIEEVAPTIRAEIEEFCSGFKFPGITD
ncbi:MAG: serine hydroxymethyltransferase [Thermoguttaceae bacterium]|jgi:glycine hydroxymethyltransferase|nr:serine hydroxymethyltransferase [Thermoguttaceae bacterium]